MLRLTELAQQICRQVLKPGDVAVDATVGNGYDTLFLAETVGTQGRVYGFDIQPAALEQARERLRQIPSEHVRLIPGSHAELDRHIADENRGRIQVIMFNLGYLPGGDKQITTRSDTTLKALEIGCRQLADEGLISIIAYPGHPGGQTEMTAVESFLQQKANEGWHLKTHQALEHITSAPRLYVLSPTNLTPDP